jgi:hypothetical protein
VKRLLGLSYDAWSHDRLGQFIRGIPSASTATIANRSGLIEFRFTFPLAGDDTLPTPHSSREFAFRPEQLAAFVIGELRDRAEKYLGRRVSHVAPSVPGDAPLGFRLALASACNSIGTDLVLVHELIYSIYFILFLLVLFPCTHG